MAEGTHRVSITFELEEYVAFKHHVLEESLIAGGMYRDSAVVKAALDWRMALGAESAQAFERLCRERGEDPAEIVARLIRDWMAQVAEKDEV
jgi:hypothetical protein